MSRTIEIKPQPGPQTVFLSTSADIAFYGGAAGGGKTFALLLEPVRHSINSKFGGLIFRRNSVQVRIQGGLWDESAKIYRGLGARPVDYRLQWVFRSGMRMKFGHLEHEDTVYDYQGGQIAYIGFDELTHFTRKQFFYMLSRNRSDSGVSGYIRATCNADADSWVADFIAWWINQETGFPIPERSGVIRWFIVIDDVVIWADSKEELIQTYGNEQMPMSFTFVAAKIYDNKILMQNNPGYLASLKALPKIERERLLDGNWKVRASAGNFFRKGWFETVDAIPAGWKSVVRFWDRAATKPSPQNPNPDWTRGLKLYRYPDDTWLVADVESLQDTPLQVERLIKNTAAADGPAVKIVSQQDPGSAGVSEANAFTRMLQGYDVHTVVLSKDKITRAKPVSAQCEAGNIKVLRAKWNNAFFTELENFPDGKHDDQVDALSGAYNDLLGASVGDFTKKHTQGTKSKLVKNEEY